MTALVCSAWVAMTWPQAIVLILFGPILLMFLLLFVIMALVAVVLLLLAITGALN